MITALHTLWPLLPAELRRQIYFYASVPTTPAQLPTTAGLPFATKTYNCAHTTTTICAVHYGNVSLLALEEEGYLEGSEYHDWIVQHGVEVRVVVVFKGHVNTFVQKDWDEKMVRQWRKLGRKEAWIAKAAKWHVKVVMEPRMESLARVREGRVLEMVNGIAETVAGWQEGGVRERRGNVRIDLHLPVALATYSVVSGRWLGLGRFVNGCVRASGARTEERVVFVSKPEDNVRVNEKVGVGLVKVDGGQEKEKLVVRGDDFVEWDEEMRRGRMIIKRVVEGEQMFKRIGSVGRKDEKEDWVMMSLLEECRCI